jgi:hypothetical protein
VQPAAFVPEEKGGWNVNPSEAETSR